MLKCLSGEKPPVLGAVQGTIPHKQSPPSNNTITTHVKKPETHINLLEQGSFENSKSHTNRFSARFLHAFTFHCVAAILENRPLFTGPARQ